MDDAWALLLPELSDSTIPRLLPLCHPLNLPQDKFYTTVIESMISKVVSDLVSSYAEWILPI